MRFTKKNRRLGFEGLETRRMLDGVITTTYQNGTLTLFGDNAANAVLITSNSPGSIEIFGLSTSQSSTTTPTLINAGSSKITTNVKNVVINLGNPTAGVNDGNDLVYISGINYNVAISVQSGDGNTLINIGQFDTSSLLDNNGQALASNITGLLGPVTLGNGLAMNLGGGENTILLNQVTLHGAVGNNLNIKSGDGTSTVTIENTVDSHAANIVDSGTLTLSFNNFTAANLNVVSGIGNDLITLSSSNISGKANFSTGFGDDTLNLDHDMLGSFDAAMAAGDDHITTDTVTVVGESTLVGGIDNDTIALSNFNAGTLSVQGAAGDDTLTAANVFVARKATFDGGDGADTIWLNGFNSTNLLVNGGTGFDHLWLISVNANKNVTVNGGVGDDTANLSQLSVGSLNVNMGVGNDGVSLDTVSAPLLSITLDKGNDTVAASHVTVTGAATIAGGPGTDTYTDGGNNSYGSLDKKGIEN